MYKNITKLCFLIKIAVYNLRHNYCAYRHHQLSSSLSLSSLLLVFLFFIVITISFHIFVIIVNCLHRWCSYLFHCHHRQFPHCRHHRQYQFLHRHFFLQSFSYMHPFHVHIFSCLPLPFFRIS